jgi:hypothetical protein
MERRQSLSGPLDEGSVVSSIETSSLARRTGQDMRKAE